MRGVLAGKCGVAGDRVGGLDVMLLNKPSSVVYFQPNEQARLSELAMGMLIVANSSCDVQQPGCVIYPTNSNGLNMSNLRLWPPILQFPPTSPNQPEYLFISDTENHCIKKLNLQLKTSTVVAGECGTSGFMDGPTGFNKLNRPTSLGISRSGVLYFYDEGNEYMRKLETNNQVVTLLNGACRMLGGGRKVAGYLLRNVLCYDDWVQGETKAPEQHVIDQGEINICIEHSSRC